MTKRAMHTSELTIVHLYQREMNIYGDTGNTLILRRRAEWRGIRVHVALVGIGEEIPEQADIILGGGGQDAGQGAIERDLQTKAVALHRLAAAGVPMLMICGMYQLFGRSFATGKGAVIRGIGVLPLETVAGKERYVGNTHYDTPYGEVIGYENHSGLTYLDNEVESFGSVTLGAGNNGRDGTEGCRVRNVIGTYSHGPVLARNPRLADELLLLALQRKYGSSFVLRPLDDTLEAFAHEIAKSRPR